MNKLFKLICASLMCITLVACTAPTVEDSAKTAVNNFLSNLEAGNIEKAYSYVTADSTTDFDSLLDSENAITSMLDQYGVSDDTKKIISDTFSNLMQLSVQSHKIDSIEQISDTEYKVNATISIIDEQSISDALNSLDLDSYINSLGQDAINMFTTQGQEAATEFVMSNIATWMQSSYTEALKGLSTKEQPTTITVQKENEEWKVASMDDAQ